MWHDLGILRSWCRSRGARAGDAAPYRGDWPRPVEYPTTRRVGASPQDRADDLNAVFADSEIRAVLATIGGEDQIMVVPYLDPDLVRADPKPFLGYSDNTNLLSWLWTHGVATSYGGSTQVQLGPGPAVDRCHASALRAALLTGER